MDLVTRRTLRNGLVGGIAGTALGVVPLVLLVAPLVGGGVAGYLEREDPKRGAVAGAIAGLLMAALGTVITGVVVLVRFGDLPFVSPGVRLEGLAIAAALSLVAAVGQVVVASVGGALGALIGTERERVRERAAADSGGRGQTRRWAVVLGSVLAGIAVFLAVTLAVTVVLDPLVWPSALVGLPVGVVAGSAVAVLGYLYWTRGPASTVDWRMVGAIALVVAVVFALLLGGLWVLGQQRAVESAQHTYEYQVTLSADRTLENVTVYVPVPQATDESALGERFVETAQYNRDVPAVRGYEPEPAPVNFTYELIETEHGQMLAIAADRIEVSRVYYREVENETEGWRERIAPATYNPTDPTMGVRHDGSFTFTVTMVTNDSIETAAPSGTEPLLEPQYNRTEVDCLFGISETHRCFEYDSRIYADYETDANATVYVSTELSGRNEWFAGGWTGNEYRQWIRTELLGSSDGWYRVEGDLEIGNGRYRD